MTIPIPMAIMACEVRAYKESIVPFSLPLQDARPYKDPASLEYLAHTCTEAHDSQVLNLQPATFATATKVRSPTPHRYPVVDNPIPTMDDHMIIHFEIEN